MSLASLSVKLSQATSTSSPFTGWLDYATERVPQMQERKIVEAGGLEKDLAQLQGQGGAAVAANGSVQRPRVFYRRELGTQTLVVAKPATGGLP